MSESISEDEGPRITDWDESEDPMFRRGFELGEMNQRLLDEDELTQLRGVVESQDVLIATLQDRIRRLKWMRIWRPGLRGGRCRSCSDEEPDHRMTCRHYVGPLQHLWITRRFNPTFGGTDYYCSCGRSVRVDEEVPVCPDVALTWRYSTEEST